MRIMLTLALLLPAVAAHAAPPLEKFEGDCLLRAGTKLPRVAGMQVTTSAVKPVPPGHEGELDPNLKYRLAEIDFTAVGQEYKSVFVCAYNPAKDVLIVQPVK